MKILLILYFIGILMSCGGGSSSDTVDSHWFGQAEFYPINEYNTFYGTTEIGDVNGDNLNDIVVIATNNSPKTIYVFYQNSDNMLEPYITFKISRNDYYLEVTGIKIGDLNNDGYMDLAVLSGNGLTVLYQDKETHTLIQKNTISVSGGVDLDIGDLNSDGLNDVVVKSGYSFSVVYQNSNGELEPEQYYNYLYTPGVLNRTEVHIADMDGDGDHDIIVQTQVHRLAIIKQAEDGTLNTEPEYIELGSNNKIIRAIPFSVGDLNNDGLTDLVAVDSGIRTTYNLFYQGQTGNMLGPILIESLPQFDGIEIADVNLDGINEIIGETTYIGNPFYGKVNVFYQEDGSFLGSYKSYRYETSSAGGTTIIKALSIGDVNGDGLPDAVVTWSDDGLFVLPNVTE